MQMLPVRTADRVQRIVRLPRVRAYRETERSAV